MGLFWGLVQTAKPPAEESSGWETLHGQREMFLLLWLSLSVKKTI